MNRKTQGVLITSVSDFRFVKPIQEPDIAAMKGHRLAGRDDLFGNARYGFRIAFLASPRGYRTVEYTSPDSIRLAYVATVAIGLCKPTNVLDREIVDQ